MYILFDLLIIQCKMNDKKIGFRSLCNINFLIYVIFIIIYKNCIHFVFNCST